MRKRLTNIKADNYDQSVEPRKEIISAAKESEETRKDILEIVELPPANAQRIEGMTGTLVGFNSEGEPLVDFSGNPARGPVAALSTVPVNAGQAGKKIVLAFEGYDPRKPIITGVVRTRADLIQDNLSVEIDGEKIIFDAKKEIVLRCGEASITLTRAGKVLIRGKYLVSSSTGFNQIKGGSVSIN